MSRILLRGLLLTWGILVAAWALWSLAATRDEARLGAVSARIAAGEPFKAEILTALDGPMGRVEAEASPKPDVLRSVAIIRLRLAELEIGSGRPLTGNAAFARAEATIRDALAKAPSDAFLWFGLAWLGKTRDGFRAAQVPLLRMSYDTGEHEGWVAVHRDALAAGVLPLLPADLQDRVTAEFRNLVTSGYAPAAAAILAGPGWGQRDRLLAALAPAPEADRRRFSFALQDLGVDVAVPGIERRAARPWQ